MRCDARSRTSSVSEFLYPLHSPNPTKKHPSTKYFPHRCAKPLDPTTPYLTEAP